jgi:hypothetical protein
MRSERFCCCPRRKTIRRSRASVPPRNPRTRVPSLGRLHTYRAKSGRSRSFADRRIVPTSLPKSLRVTRTRRRRAPRLAGHRSRGSGRSFVRSSGPVAGSRGTLCGCRGAAPQPTAARGHPARRRHNPRPPLAVPWTRTRAARQTCTCPDEKGPPVSDGLLCVYTTVDCSRGISGVHAAARISWREARGASVLPVLHRWGRASNRRPSQKTYSVVR